MRLRVGLLQDRSADARNAVWGVRWRHLLCRGLCASSITLLGIGGEACAGGPPERFAGLDWDPHAATRFDDLALEPIICDAPLTVSAAERLAGGIGHATSVSNPPAQLRPTRDKPLARQLVEHPRPLPVELLDRDGDRRLTGEELAGMDPRRRASLMRSFDTDRDGILSSEELALVTAPLQESPAPSEPVEPRDPPRQPPERRVSWVDARRQWQAQAPTPRQYFSQAATFRTYTSTPAFAGRAALAPSCAGDQRWMLQGAAYRLGGCY
jgi:hypothetical protein